jgi:RimJ/RimL family protein N-acetyltransferase
MKIVTLETDRLTLRCLRMTDARALTQAVQLSIDSLGAFLFWADASYDLEAARVFIRSTRENRENNRDLNLGIFDAETNEFLGMIGLMHIAAPTLGFEIGYWLRSDQQGFGYTTEAAQQIIQYAFDKLGAHRVWLNCDVKNMGSRRVAEKLGMRREGRVKAFLIDPKNRMRDHYLYGLLKTEFGT